MNNQVFSKLLSGRLWLTIISGIVFAYCAFTKILNAECVGAICVMVFQSYFSRPDRGQNGVKPTDLPKSPSGQ